MITVTKLFKFDCAHMLSGYKGPCANLHGHTYTLEVEFSSDGLISEGSAVGMVVDFNDIKRIVDEEIIAKFDHAFIFNTISADEAELRIMDVLKTFKLKIMQFPDRPTAENMANYFLRILCSAIEREGFDVNVSRIRVWETPTSYAEVYGVW